MKFRHVLQSLGVDGMAKRYPKGDISTACLLPGLTDQPDFIRVLTLWLIFLSLLYRFICVLLESQPPQRGLEGVIPYLSVLALPRPPPEGLPVLLGQLPPGSGWSEGRESLLRALDLAIVNSSVLHFPGLGECANGDYEDGHCASAGLLAR